MFKRKVKVIERNSKLLGKITNRINIHYNFEQNRGNLTAVYTIFIQEEDWLHVVKNFSSVFDEHNLVKQVLKVGYEK